MQDLSTYSIGQLRTLDQSVSDELKRRQSQQIGDAREQILKLAQSAGINLAELVGMKSPKVPKPSGTVKAKYRHPQHPDQQWTGRGRQPAWVKEWINSGKSIDDMLV